MDETDKDFRKAFEDVTNKNIETVIKFTKETRIMFQEMKEELTVAHNKIKMQNETIEQFRIQLAGLQTKVFSGGT